MNSALCCVEGLSFLAVWWNCTYSQGCCSCHSHVINVTTPLTTPPTLIRGVNRKSHPAMLPVGFPFPPSQPHLFSWAVGGQLRSSHIKMTQGTQEKLWGFFCEVGLALAFRPNEWSDGSSGLLCHGSSHSLPQMSWRVPCARVGVLSDAHWSLSAACPEQDLAEMCPSSLVESRKGDEPQWKRNKNLNRTRMGSAYEFCGWSTAWVSLWNHHLVSLIIQRNAACDIRRLN